MSIARDAGVISDAQQKEIDELFTGKDGNFDEEAFSEAFARELKRAFHETVQKRMEDVPTTKAGRALRRVADFIVTLAKSFAFWRQERGLDPVTGQPLQAGQVLDAFLKRERTAVDEATRLDNLARAARAASLRATAEARDNAPTQAVVDEDGTVVAYHESERGGASELDSVPKHEGIGEDVLDALAFMLRTGRETTLYTREFGDVLLSFGRFLNQVPGLKGKGFLHVLEERTRKDGLSVLEAIEVILKSVEAAVRGKENKALRQGVRHAIDLNGYRAIVADNGDFREFITGYKIFTNEEKEKRSGVETDAIRRSEDYNPTFYDRLRQEGAERLGNRIAKLLEGRQVQKSVEELEQELDDLNVAYYRLFNARKKAEENGASQEELEAFTKDMDENREKHKQVAKAKKKLNRQRAKERKIYGNPNEERRDHIHVWSGARQAYDRVDLRFIGSGTGGNNEGRGAYSSGVRGVAQDRYAMYKVAEWKEAKEIGFSPDNLPIVYDGKAMRLGVAVGRARSNVRVASEKGISPSIEDEAIIRIYSDAQTYLLDNGFIDYDEFRYYIFSVYVRLSQRLDGLLFTIRSLEKVLSSPREKRMMYKNNKGTAAKWSSTRTFQTESNGEMRDVYVVDDEYGGVNYIDVEYAQKLYEQSKRELEENKDAFKEEQENYEKVRALYDGILPEENPLASETELPLPAVMEQTWFTNRPEGDVSHLISWLDPVTPEQMDWIVEAAEKAGFSEEEIAFLKRDRIDNWDVMIPKGSRVPPSGSEMYMRLELIAMMRDNQFVTLDEVKDYDLWRAHRDVMGDAGKFASEFLLTADIDGVRYPVNYRGGSRHGEEGWNYVAFSDEHLRVDHVYEYNPETDDFELKWHEGGGSGPRFTETPLGQELVARAFDAIMGSRVDLLLRPSRFYGNPYETRERNPRNALVTEHLHRDVDVSEPKGFATEVSAEISRFGTREGDPTLRDIRARCGSKARFYEVLGAVYETAEAVRSGLAEVVTGRERAMMSNAGLQAADFIKHNATARATAAGRKLYLMGREFAWKLYQEDIASAWAEVERQRRGRGDCGMIGGKCEGKGPSRHGERRWPKARRMR